MLHLWHDGQVRMMAYRKAHPDMPIHDMRYKDLASDPVAADRGIYDRIGWDFTPATEAGVIGWLAENPADKHGKHKSRPEELGLNTQAVRSGYAQIHTTICKDILRLTR